MKRPRASSVVAVQNPESFGGNKIMKYLRVSLLAQIVFVGFSCASSALAATFPRPFDTEKGPGGPMPAEEVAAGIEMPPGFHCTVFAAEPDVAQPIAMATDSRGRLWVAENYTYSERTTTFTEELRDRIVIFEDTDNDGRFDRRTVFWEGAQRLTSIEIGFGGVWAICLPNLVFIPDRNGDDIPDGDPEILLNGFDYKKARHNVANGLRWGPDGWLYGRQGILGLSPMGKPGTPENERTLLNAGIWRFHPLTKTFEIVAEGTTNPWGMDWDSRGEGFFINTVIGHLWHIIPGAHYRRMAGEDRNPYVYELIEQHADHVHWASNEVWTDVRKGVTDQTLARGGGHAHTGLLIYQGGQWPAEWNGKLLTINFHGRRFNMERLERDGSGYVGRAEPDNFIIHDAWFRGIDLIAAPDGGIFVSDWSDTGECHDNDGVHRSSGRIYKITYGAGSSPVGDVARSSGEQLAQLQLSKNDWLSRQARRIMADQAAAGGSLVDAHAALNRMLAESKDSLDRLRALWALQVSGGMAANRLTELLADSDEHVRAWAIRLILDGLEGRVLSAENFKEFTRLAKSDPSPLVRLALASALQRVPREQKMTVSSALLQHTEDANDHNLPLMLWYGIESLSDIRDLSFAGLIADARIPRVQKLGARRLAEDIDLAPQGLDHLLASMVGVESVDRRQAVLEGIDQGLSGRRQAPKPASWDIVQRKFSVGANEAMVAQLRNLNAIFGDGRALDEIRGIALNTFLDFRQRRAALQLLVESRPPDLRAICERLIPVRELAATAATGLAQFDDPAVGDLLLKEWARVSANEKPALMSVLLSRPAWAAKVLQAISLGTLTKTAVTAFQARQIRSFHDAALTKRLEEVWGATVDESEANQLRASARWMARLGPDRILAADAGRGRAIFTSLCSGCHILYGEGGKIGPDLTGAARDNLGYLLENILFPSVVVPDEYRLSTVTLKDGQVVTGMLRARTVRSVRLQTLTELASIPVSEIAKEETSPTSLMPPGLIEALNDGQAADLMAYLMSKGPKHSE
jgi:putative membrane-bound dehydrogenase-like protein